MNRADVARLLTALSLLALVACTSKRSASPAENGNWGAPQAAQTTDGSPGDLAGQGASTGSSQTDTQEVKSDELEAEIISRDGTVTRADPSRGDWSETSLICFPDCKGAPHDSLETDLIVLKDGQRKLVGANRIVEHSYNILMHVWEGKAIRVFNEGGEEDIPMGEIRYIKLSDHNFGTLEQALRVPSQAHYLSLSGDKSKHLPSKLGRLTNLKELHLSCFEYLEDLPSEIGNLRQLEKLIMDNGNGCQMNIALPESIGQLQRLRVLKLYGAMDPFEPDPEFPGRPARRKSLPQTLADLQNLEELDLGRNGSAIRAVPPQIASLHNLKRLNLEFDEIRVVPSFIGRLTHLRELLLVGNHHHIEFPDSLDALEGLKVSMGNNYLKLKDQERLRKRFPKLIFDFENEYDDDSANEEAPEPPQPKNDTDFKGNRAKTADGWRISWNQPGTPFTLELAGKDIRSLHDLPEAADISTKVMSLNVDGVLFQVRSVAIGEFTKKVGDQKLSDQAILAAHRDWEIQSVEHVLGEKLNVTSTEQRLTIGQALLWQYDRPKKRGLEQMYVTTVIGGNVVVLNGPVELKSAENTIQKLLLETMSTLKVARVP